MLSSTACPDYSGKSRLAGKTFLHTLFFFLLATQICFAQWYQQNSGTTKNLHDVVFLNAYTGIAVGDSGLILRSTNDGLNWVMQPSGTSNNLNDVFFNNSNTGYAVGDSGTIIKTTNWGLSWVEQSSGTFATLKSVCFIDENNGWVCGAEYSTMAISV